jgi:hypothetical protein
MYQRLKKGNRDEETERERERLNCSGFKLCGFNTVNCCDFTSMEQHALKNANNCFNSNIYSNLETSGGQSYYLYLNVVHFFNTSVN